MKTQIILAIIGRAAFRQNARCVLIALALEAL